ncbi:phage tail tube protein [Moraxella sp. ZJ142]|uniref:phage tail tube protein n=1 Tax=Moraxella marmotae TaxID=3344520 RepID=UPI0035D4EF69
MSSGARVVSAFVKQTDKTIPQTGWKILPNISNGLTVSTEMTESEILAGGRLMQKGMVTGASVSGDIETELMYSVYDELIAAAFWSEWQANKLTIGTTKSEFAITKDFTDINVNHIFERCVVSNFSLNIDTSSLVKIKFGFTGLGYQQSKDASFAKSPTPAADGIKASSLSIGDILIDGQKIDVCVESLSFELDNQTEVQKCLGDNIYGGNVLAMLANITGSMTIAYSPKAHDIISNQMTGATLSLEFPIMFGDNKYILKLPKIQVTGEIPSPSGKDLVAVDVSYTVVDETPVLERV